MSHCVKINSDDLSYHHFADVCDKSKPDEIIRLIKNNNGEIYLSSHFSLLDRFIELVSHIPWLSGFECIANHLQGIELQKRDAIVAFLETLNNGFGDAFLLGRLPEVKNGGDYLACKDIAKYVPLASKVNYSSFMAKYFNQTILVFIKKNLMHHFPKIGKEFSHCLLGNNDSVLKKFHDEIDHHVNVILTQAKVPENIHDSIHIRILEYININALKNSYSLSNVTCFLYKLLGFDKKRENLNQISGKPFELTMDETLALLNISMDNDSNALDDLLINVFLLNEKIKVKSSEDRNTLRTGLCASYVKQFYINHIKTFNDVLYRESVNFNDFPSQSIPEGLDSLKNELSDTSSIDSFLSSKISEDNSSVIISLDESHYFPPLPTSEELVFFQEDLSDVDDFPPPPPPPPSPPEELHLYQDESSETSGIDSFCGSTLAESSGNKERLLSDSEC